MPNGEWFSTLTFFDGGSMHLRDDFIYNVEGIGNIKFKYHNGTLISLIEIIYVLEMRKKLISLGMLDSKRL